MNKSLFASFSSEKEDIHFNTNARGVVRLVGIGRRSGNGAVMLRHAKLAP
jgi:hypothetical protein